MISPPNLCYLFRDDHPGAVPGMDILGQHEDLRAAVSNTGEPGTVEPAAPVFLTRAMRLTHS